MSGSIQVLRKDTGPCVYVASTSPSKLHPQTLHEPLNVLRDVSPLWIHLKNSALTQITFSSIREAGSHFSLLASRTFSHICSIHDTHAGDNSIDFPLALHPDPGWQFSPAFLFCLCPEVAFGLWLFALGKMNIWLISHSRYNCCYPVSKQLFAACGS